MSNNYSGSCLCDQVKFDIVGSFDGFYLCHCKFCQKDTGSAHSANLFSSGAQLNWMRGIDKIKTFNLAPTRHTKSFCKECGSALPNLQMEGKLLVVPAGSLDSELSVKPEAHIFWSSKSSWSKELENLKKFEKLP
ncbi:MAG: GFA family protein [Bdellovibrionota bacterium]